MDSWTRRDTETFLKYQREQAMALEEILKLLKERTKDEGKHEAEEEKSE